MRFLLRNNLVSWCSYSRLKNLHEGSRLFCSKQFVLPKLEDYEEKTGLISTDNYDKKYFLNPANQHEIIKNVKLRQIAELSELFRGANGDPSEIGEVIRENMSKLPNKLHRRWMELETNDQQKPVVVEEFGKPPEFNFEPKSAEKLLQRTKLLLTTIDPGLGHIGGHRSYVLLGDLARLENVLADWTMTQLVSKFNFTPVVTPNLLYEDIVEGCGFNPKGERTQVYSVDGVNSDGFSNWRQRIDHKDVDSTNMNRVCLAGTAEIALVGMHLGKRFDVDSLEKIEQLPKRYCAFSRCYRAETSNVKEESGLFRVHYFSKVEMVALARREESENLLQEFVDIQKYLFAQLGLQCKVLDMPPHELGLPAKRKFDIEAYFPGRTHWGEISSASDCGDFQSRRFNIRYRYVSQDYAANEPYKEDFVATINGTACASPRILLPLIEANQDNRGRIRIPAVLQEAMGQEYLHKLKL